MRSRLSVLLLLFNFLAGGSSAQEILIIPHKEAASLRMSLNGKLHDTTRVDKLLALAHYYLLKPGENKRDLDSAMILEKKASALNATLRLHKRDGYVLLIQAKLAREKGDKAAAAQLNERATRLFKADKNEFRVAMALHESLHYYDLNQQTGMNGLLSQLDKVLLQLQHIQKADQVYILDCLVNFYQKYMWEYGDSAEMIFVQRILPATRVIKEKEYEFWARKEVADLQYRHGKVTEALNQVLEILREQKAVNSSRICYTYDLLAGIYVNTSNYDKAIMYALETVRHIRTDLDSIHLPNFFTRLAYIYQLVKKDEESLAWSMKAYRAQVALGDFEWIFDIVERNVNMLISTGQKEKALRFVLENQQKYVPSGIIEEKTMLKTLAIAYAALNQNVLAEKYFLKFIELAEGKDLSRNLSYGDYGTYYVVANFYFKLGQYAKAEKYFKISMDKYPKAYASYKALNKYVFLYKLDSARGNFLSAINHLQASQSIKDSMLTATKSKQIEDLKISYETEQKDQLLLLNDQNIKLLTKEGELQKNKLHEAGLLRNISIAGVTLLLVIVALLFYGYRSKQRNNIKLQAQQTEISHQNQALQHLVTEKDWLVKEIHHRVKNNLQIVMSLLNAQSAYIDNEPALTAIHDSQHRVHAMSLIHQKLYSTENVSSIDMSFYIRELVAYLADSFDTGGRIHFELEITPLQMDVSQAVPLGLILNEAITNSIKYAFPGNQPGLVRITLSRGPGNRCTLEIADNGTGIPAHLDNKKPGSLGMSLMAGLSEDLAGTCSIENKNGTVISISFLHDVSIKKTEASLT